MRFGLALPHYDFSLPGIERVGWPFVRDWAQQAEDLGFHSLWMSDHLFLDLSKYGGTSDPAGSMECFTTLAALATCTQRVRLGTLVVCNGLRPPALVAKMAATLDVLSGGRLELGLGAGWYEPEYRAAGIPFEAPGRRVEQLEEAVQVVKGMLTEPSFSFAGKHYRVEEAWNLPQPVSSPRPPIWVGGRGKRVVSLAGRHADGYNTVWAVTPQTYAERLEMLERGARRAGRNPADVKRSVGLYALVGHDELEVAARWDRYLAAADPGVASAAPHFEVWAADKLAGRPDHIADRIRAFEALGVEEIVLGFGLVPFQIADASGVDAFAHEIFPRFR